MSQQKIASGLHFGARQHSEFQANLGYTAWKRLLAFFLIAVSHCVDVECPGVSVLVKSVLFGDVRFPLAVISMIYIDANP